MPTYTPNAPVQGDTRGSAERWMEYFLDVGVNHPEDVRQFVETWYEFGPHPEIMIGAHKGIAQAIHETSDDRDGDGVFVPFTSEAWDYRNPAGIGVTRAEERGWHRFKNGREAALAHIIRVVWYTRGSIPDVLKPHLHTNPRALPESVRGKRHTLQEFGNADWRAYPTWAADDTYGQKWADVLNRLEHVFADPVDIPKEDPMGAYTIPGLPGGPLQLSFRTVIDLIPASRTYQRPGILLSGSFETCQHMTANWNSLAPAEAAYFLRGAEGRQASVHGCIDDSVLYILLPLNEVGWHAGDGAGPGNMSTVALELCQLRAMVNDPTRWRRARRNAAEFMGKVAARRGAPPPGKFHHDYSGKWCPAVLLNNPAWVREYHEDYSYFYAMERKAMTGDPTPGQPAPEPVVYHIGDTIKTLVNLNLRNKPTTAGAPLVTLQPGVEMVIVDRFEWADGYGWLPVRTKGGMNGWVAMGQDGVMWIELVKRGEPAPEPEPEPTYVDPRPIKALLDTDVRRNDTAPGIVTDDLEQDFIFVADVIEFDEPHVAAEFAVENPRKVKADYKKGDRAVAAWLVRSKETKSWWYILTGPDDEWIRVRYEGTHRISDAPLLPDDPDVDDVIAVITGIIDRNNGA